MAKMLPWCNSKSMTQVILFNKKRGTRNLIRLSFPLLLVSSTNPLWRERKSEQRIEQQSSQRWRLWHLLFSSKSLSLVIEQWIEMPAIQKMTRKVLACIRLLYIARETIKAHPCLWRSVASNSPVNRRWLLQPHTTSAIDRQWKVFFNFPSKRQMNIGWQGQWAGKLKVAIRTTRTQYARAPADTGSHISKLAGNLGKSNLW